MRILFCGLVLLFCVGALFADEVDELIEKLGSDEWSEREAASKALAEKGSEIIPRLIDAYKESDDAEVKKRIDTILEKFGYPTVEGMNEIEKLLSAYEELAQKPLMKSEFQKEAKKLIEKVKKIDNAAVYLSEQLASCDEKERALSLSSLLAGSVEGADEGGPGDGISIVEVGKRAVIRVGGKKIVVGDGGSDLEGDDSDYITPTRALLNAVNCNKENIREAALKALVQRRELAAVGKLVQLLTEEDEMENRMPAWLRRNLKQREEEMKKMKERLKAKRLSIAGALRQLTGEDFGPDKNTPDDEFLSETKKWKDWWLNAKERPEYRKALLNEKILVLELKEKDAKRHLRGIENARKELKKQLEGVGEKQEEDDEK